MDIVKIFQIFRKTTFLSFIFFLIPASVPATEDAEGKQISTCVACHKDLSGNLAEPVTLWQKSYHYQMGNTCKGCHGGDPTDMDNAMSPEKGFAGVPAKEDIPSFCGKCHIGVKENYMKSLHYSATFENRGPNCITCHSSHDVKKASINLINEALCSRCHSFENGRKIKEAFISAEMALYDYQNKIEFLENRGMMTKRLKEKLFALKNSLHQMTHTLDVKEIENKTQMVLKNLEEMNTEIELFKSKVYKRWLIGIVTAVFLIVLIIVLVQLLKTYEENE